MPFSVMFQVIFYDSITYFVPTFSDLHGVSGVSGEVCGRPFVKKSAANCLYQKSLPQSDSIAKIITFCLHKRQLQLD